MKTSKSLAFNRVQRSHEDFIAAQLSTVCQLEINGFSILRFGYFQIGSHMVYQSAASALADKIFSLNLK